MPCLRLTHAAVSFALLAGAAHAETMDQQKAEAFVAPFYEMLSNLGTADVAAGIAAMATPDYRSYGSNDKGDALPEIAAGLKALGTAVPDLAFRVVDVIPADNTIVVRGEATGTPVVPFFGVEPTGKSFRIMSIDVWTLTDGKVSAIHHVEDWATAIRQLSGG